MMTASPPPLWHCPCAPGSTTCGGVARQGGGTRDWTSCTCRTPAHTRACLYPLIPPPLLPSSPPPLRPSTPPPLKPSTPPPLHPSTPPPLHPFTPPPLHPSTPPPLHPSTPPPLRLRSLHPRHCARWVAGCRHNKSEGEWQLDCGGGGGQRTLCDSGGKRRLRHTQTHPNTLMLPCLRPLPNDFVGLGHMNAPRS